MMHIRRPSHGKTSMLGQMKTAASQVEPLDRTNGELKMISKEAKERKNKGVFRVTISLG